MEEIINHQAIINKTEILTPGKINLSAFEYKNSCGV